MPENPIWKVVWKSNNSFTVWLYEFAIFSYILFQSTAGNNNFKISGNAAVLSNYSNIFQK